MKVKVEYLGHVKNITSSVREEEIDISNRASISELLMFLSEKYGESFKKAVYEHGSADVKSNYIITINGYLLNQLDGVKTKLKHGDHVALLPVVSGG